MKVIGGENMNSENNNDPVMQAKIDEIIKTINAIVESYHPDIIIIVFDDDFQQHTQTFIKKIQNE